MCLEKLVRIRFESRFTSFKPRRHLLQQPRVESSSVAEAASLKIAALLCCLFPVWEFTFYLFGRAHSRALGACWQQWVVGLLTTTVIVSTFIQFIIQLIYRAKFKLAKLSGRQVHIELKSSKLKMEKTHLHSLSLSRLIFFVRSFVLTTNTTFMTSTRPAFSWVGPFLHAIIIQSGHSEKLLEGA